jgi:hypothetical protein
MHEVWPRRFVPSMWPRRRRIERLFVKEFAEEAALDGVVGDRPIGALARPLDKLEERVCASRSKAAS